MQKLNFIWKRNLNQYANGEILYINRINVARYNWNSMRSKGDNDETIRYAGSINLPSLKTDRTYGQSPEDIKPKIEQIIIGWFNEALKEVK